MTIAMVRFIIILKSHSCAQSFFSFSLSFFVFDPFFFNVFIFFSKKRVAIIVGACLNKVPIMWNMWKARSAEGVSRAGLYTESLVYANAAAYGFLEQHPFTAYGENVSLFLQNFMLIVLVWSFSRPSSWEMIGLSLNAVVYVVVVATFLPEEYRYVLQVSNSAIMLYSRTIQSLETHALGHTGTQSSITNTLNLVGGLFRIYTTINETDDTVVLVGYVLSVALNTAIFLQYFKYRANTVKFLKERQQKKQQEETTAKDKKKKEQ